MTLEPKGMESGCVGNPHNTSNGQMIPGLKMAPNTSELSEYRNLVTRIYSLKRGKNFVRGTDGIDGRGGSKKLMPVCNGQDRGISNLKGCKLAAGTLRQKREANP